jgi:hypothetical protein
MQTSYIAVIGGTASVIGGGKFANGAETAAFGYLFNSIWHSNNLSISKSTFDSSINDSSVGNSLNLADQRIASTVIVAQNSYINNQSPCATAECAAGLLPAPSENRTQSQIDYGQCKLTCSVAGTPLTMTVNVLTGLGSVGTVLGAVGKTSICSTVCSKP